MIDTYVPDTPRSVIAELKPQKVEGLWFEYKGEKVTPSRVYFGIDVRFRGKGFENEVNGRAFCHFDCALHPVYLPDGTRFRRADLCNVCAEYKNGVLYDWYRE